MQSRTFFSNYRNTSETKHAKLNTNILDVVEQFVMGAPNYLGSHYFMKMQ